MTKICNACNLLDEFSSGMLLIFLKSFIWAGSDDKNLGCLLSFGRVLFDRRADGKWGDAFNLLDKFYLSEFR